jgi:hypothetical protein
MKEAKKYYLKCDISDGMFSSEKHILFKDAEDKPICGFLQNESVKGDKLEVKVIETKENKSLIQVPFSDYPLDVYVNNNLVVYE